MQRRLRSVNRRVGLVVIRTGLVLSAFTWGALYPASAYAISAISVQIGAMEGDFGQARNVSLQYQLAGSRKPNLNIKGQIKLADEQQWSEASLVCDTFSLPQPKSPAWRCNQGKLTTERIKAPFSLSLIQQPQQFALTLELQQASLSDAAGLHAGEKISAKLSANATRSQNQWRWQADADWLSGEAFWQPFYFASGGHRLQASGVMNAQFLDVDTAELSLKDVGKASFSGQLRLADRRLQSIKLSAPNLKLEALYPLLLKPLLEKSALNDLEVAGNASVQLEMQEGAVKAFQLDLNHVDVADKNNRFALYKLNASIPWSYDEAKAITLGFESGSLLKLPLGATNLKAEVNRYALTAPQLSLPVLDGALNLSNVSAAWLDKQWHWHLQAQVTPIDMVALSQALGLSHMEGKVAASVPLVTYSAGQLTTDGEIGLNVFDGNITVQHLAMQNPLGAVPKLTADLQMRNLDLGVLTRTFSFGAIEGQLDGDVNSLQLVNWKPVHLDANLYSSSGRYPKKISQRAVENISALGGAGAVAAIQRSFLRFFKQFNYAKIGLSCKLRNDTCEMGGVETTQQGYIIVKGSGIPSITVLGYNRYVSWGELLDRIKRITAGNVAPVVK